MTVGITGHTKGVGKAIFDKLSTTYNIQGFSRTNGYNLKNYQEIVPLISNFDVFINNTYYLDHQEKLFLEVFNRWKSKPKTIINVLNASTILNPQTKLQYSKDKSNFFETIKTTIIKNPNKICRVINIHPGTIEPNKMYPDSKVKLDPQIIANQVDYILKLPQDLEITCLVILPTTLYRNNTTLL